MHVDTDELGHAPPGDERGGGVGREHVALQVEQGDADRCVLERGPEALLGRRPGGEGPVHLTGHPVAAHGHPPGRRGEHEGEGGDHGRGQVRAEA